MDNNNLNNNNGAVAPIVPFTSTYKPLNCDEAMTITTITDLQSYSQGCVVRFPDFAEGQPFVARVVRPSMLVLAKSGKIPNSLLKTAGGLFAKGGDGLSAEDTKMLGDMQEICETIADASLKSPSLSELKEAGIELTDEQLMAIFNYAQSGFKALDSFCKE